MKRPKGHESDAAGPNRMGLGKKVLDLYFRPKRMERWKDGKMYEFLGIRMFKKIVVGLGHFFGVDNTKANSYFISDTSTEGLRAFEKRTRRSEAIHSPITIYLTYAIIIALAEGKHAVAYVAAFIWVLNAYPTMLQRYNRVRIENVLYKMKSRRAAIVASE